MTGLVVLAPSGYRRIVRSIIADRDQQLFFAETVPSAKRQTYPRTAAYRLQPIYHKFRALFRQERRDTSAANWPARCRRTEGQRQKISGLAELQRQASERPRHALRILE